MSALTGAGFDDSLEDTVAIMDAMKRYPNSIAKALDQSQTRRLNVVRHNVLADQGL
ncbi:MAG: hypothetical protein E6Y08_01710 [Paenibacillus sp.]|uniref:hypothetical protein n=1 Tax=Paenibacillus sp. TaxID=58172 RepID=UPI00290A5D58|nr:hypothetical protein [Paenibacillus sp.]MDU4694506.1 hypothetical protein [Paenibacillus sp.]